MEEIYQALECLNKEKNEIKSTTDYKLGHAIKMYATDFLKFRYKKIFKNLKNKRASRIIKKKYYNPEQYELKDNGVDYKSAKIAVYTCIIGGYDKLQEPLIEFDNVDYYLFTDNEKIYENYKGKYKIIQIPDYLLKKGNIIANRYIKLHASDFFEKYDYSIYMDGNVRIIADIRTFVARSSLKTGIAMHIHRERNCIYQEAEVCKLLKRGNQNKIEEQMKRYKQEGFPEKFGMNEATIIVSDLKNNESSKLLNEWYLEFLQSESYRDQLAWPYILWKNNYKISDVGNLGNNIYKNYKVEMVMHDN